MSKVQFATRVDDDQAKAFRDTTARLGTTPSDTLRMFIAAFNEYGGFPYEVRVATPVSVEAFDNEEEAVRFASSLAMGALYEAR